MGFCVTTNCHVFVGIVRQVEMLSNWFRCIFKKRQSNTQYDKDNIVEILDVEPVKIGYVCMPMPLAEIEYH